MADITELVEEIKRAAVGAVDAGKPCGVFFGVVKSEKPLEILVEQKLTLGGEQLILSRTVTDYEIEVEMDWDKLTAEPILKKIKDKKKIKVQGSLKAGERVVLIRLTGGQRFLVADRVGDD